MLILLFSLAAVVTADIKTVTLIQSFDLKADKADIDCTGLQQVYIASQPVKLFKCTGTIATGMSIHVQMDKPATPNEKKVTWLIEFKNGNLTSSLEVIDKVEELVTSSVTAVNLTQKVQTEQTNRVQIRRKREEKDSTIASTSPPSKPPSVHTSKETAAPVVTTPTKKPDDKTTQPPAPTPPVDNKVNVTVNYFQFNSGQAPVYVNKHSAAVVVAVLEGLILAAILAVVILRQYNQSKLRAAGMYPSDYQSNNPTSAAYYNNGSNLQRSTRPDIPSYRTPDPQPPVRLDPLPPRTQQPVDTPTLVPASPMPATAITPAPLNYWPDQPGAQGRAQPIRNIMDSDI